MTMTTAMNELDCYYISEYAGAKRLTVKPEKFNEMMNLELPEEMVSVVSGADYLNVAHAVYLLKVHFPTLSVEYVTTADGLPFIDVSEEDERGTLVGVYLQEARTGARTGILWLAVMMTAKGKLKPADPLPDARRITDNMARAAVKAIAYFTGIGFELYTRIEGLDLILSEGGSVDTKSAKSTKSTKSTKSKKRTVDEDEYDEDDEYEEDEDYDEDDEDDEEDEEDEPVRKKSSRKEQLLPRRIRK